MKYVVQFSAGKDSQATLIKACNDYGVEKVIAVFLNTKWETPITYNHHKYVIEKIGVASVELTTNKFDGMKGMVLHKGRFPSSQARFCTEELKIKPFVDWLLEEVNEHVIILQGIRAEESTRRSEMEKECRYFKYYFEPYETNSMIVEKLEGKATSHRQKMKLAKAKKRLSEGKEDPKFFTYRKKDVFAWCEKYADDLLRPFFDASGQDVIDYIISNGQVPNPLYGMGFKRVGCWPCVLGVKSDIKQMLIHDPRRIDEIIDFEEQTGIYFFPPDYIPKRYCSMERVNKKGEMAKFPTARDVKKYIEESNATGDLFQQDEPQSCLSAYQNICE